MNGYKTMGDFLRSLRVKNGFSAREVSKFLGYKTAQAWLSIEQGRVCFRAELAYKLAQLFKISSTEILKAHAFFNCRKEARKAGFDLANIELDIIPLAQ